MVISTGIRTDILNHYSAWLYERFREGFAYARNPLFPGHVTRYRLHPDTVDAVTFCTKNCLPALSRLHEIYNRYPTYFHVTVTAFGRDMEPNIPPVRERIAMLRDLSRLVGREKVAWRFAPVFFTEKYPPERIADTFARLAEQIAPHVSRCFFAFLEPYVSMRSRCSEARLPDNVAKADFIRKICAAAEKHGLPLHSCGSFSEDSSVEQRGCFTLEEIRKAKNYRTHTVRHIVNRRGCLCIQSRDLGWYNSCPNLCRYCNANTSPAEVRKNYRLHDPHSPLLIGDLCPEDEISEGHRERYLLDTRQMSLFDL